MTSAPNRIINSVGGMVNGMMGDGHNVMTTSSQQQPMMTSQQQQQQNMRPQQMGNNPNINLVNALTGPPGAKMVNATNGPLLSLGGDINSGMNNGMMIGGNKPPNMNNLMGMMPGQQQQQQQMRPNNMMVRQAMLPQQFQQRAPNAGGMVQTQPGARMMNVRLANAPGGPPGSGTMVSGQQFVNTVINTSSGVQAGSMVMTQGQLRPGQAQLGPGMQQVSTATVNLPPRYPTQLEQTGTINCWHLFIYLQF